MPPTSLFYQRAPVNSVCNTPACNAISDMILSYVNLDVDPCSDFFQYTCGSWLKSPPVQEKNKLEEVFSVFFQTEEKNVEKIKTILEGTYDDIKNNYKTSNVGFHTEDKENVDRNNFEFLKSYYNACNDANNSVSLGPTPIFEDIAQIENTFSSVNGSDINLANILAQLSLLGIDNLFSINYDVNEYDHSVYTAILKKPRVRVDTNSTIEEFAKKMKPYIGIPSKDDAYYKIINEKSIITNFKLWSDEKILTVANSYLKFDKELSRIMQDSKADINGSYLTVQELQAIIPNIHWETYFNKLTGTTYVTSNTRILGTKEYFQNLNGLLEKTTTIELQEYLVASYLEKKKYYTFLRYLTQAELDTESAYCASNIGHTFQDLIGRYLVLETFGDVNDEELFLEMVFMLKKSLLNHISDLPWLDQPTKVQAINKINLLKEKVIYNHINPNWADPSSLQEYYKDVVIDTTSTYSAVKTANLWKNKLKWKQFTQKVPENFLNPESFAQLTNAYYNPNLNQIEIPIGILQSPIYNDEFPQYINYGGLGSIVGHEFIHSLDTLGRLYNGTGYKENWWSDYSDKEFEKRAKCIIDEFSKQYLLDENSESYYVNGTLSSGEVIADSGGINIAFLAYQQYVRTQLANKPEPSLPKLEHLTPEQMLFISHGIASCESIPARLVKAYFTDEHPPRQFRVNLALRNSVQFAKTFNCPVGKSKMNPKENEDKCVLW